MALDALPDGPVLQSSCSFCAVIDEDIRAGRYTQGARLDRIPEDEEEYSGGVQSTTDLTSLFWPEYENNTSSMDDLSRLNVMSGPTSNASTPRATSHDSAKAHPQPFADEWKKLRMLHARVHNTLDMFTGSLQERHAVDKHLCTQLGQVRSAILSKMDQAGTAASSESESGSSAAYSNDNKKSRKRQLPAASLAVLKNWLYTHRDNPYPTEIEKKAIAKEAGLDTTQVRNWCASVRA